MGGHILQKLLNHLGLESPVTAGVFQCGEICPQIEDGIPLHILCSGDDEKPAFGFAQFLVIAFHQRRVRSLALQPGHTLEDGIRPDPPLLRSGRSVWGLLPLETVLPFDGVGGKTFRHE